MTVQMSRYCGICNRSTVHQYDGLQQFSDYDLELWSCQECGGTNSDKVAKNDKDK